MKKVAIYTRVSTLEQANEGYSIEGQEKRLKAYCEVNDWDNYELFVDAGRSASSTERAGLQELLSRLNEFDLVLVYKLDRLTRSVRDLMTLLDTFEAQGVSFRSATEVFDTTSAIGKLFITLVGAMAEWERSTITERTTQGRRVATEKGIYTTTPPFYYDKIDGKLVPNEKREIVEYMVKRAKEGVSIRGITEELNNSVYNSPKNKRWDKSVVHHALTDAVSRGHTHIGEVYVENTHEPIISETDYQIIMRSISERTRSQGVRHTAIFRGKLTCHNCNRRLSLNTTKRVRNNGVVDFDERYVCDRCKSDKNSKSISIKAHKVEEAFIQHMKHYDLTTYKEKEVLNEQDEQNIIDIEKVRRQRKKYQKAWSMDLMSDEEFEDLIEETDELIAQYDKQHQKSQSYKVNQEKIEKETRSLLDGWDILSNEDKELLIRRLISDIDFKYYEGKGWGRNRTPNQIEITGVHFNF
ncbi:recombinase family protein [Staphylococcus pseudoxylosus]|uniref:recombinase family protein n=2 Tax=Staphylococcus pseudoxylosus TaxID=2282419 RepID=UPI002DBC36CA|nr:recombinase family protein [Staphylococcus pseudoxylosus]MEB5782435.1 recombinase family protein [Staphylococcus pseudoxylosus]